MSEQQILQSVPGCKYFLIIFNKFCYRINKNIETTKFCCHYVDKFRLLAGSYMRVTITIFPRPLHRTTRTLHTTAEPCTRPRNLPYVTDEEVAKRRAEGDWDCPKCGRLNFLYTDTCACSYVLTAPLARDGDWVCSFCGDYVFAYKTKCRCGEPRPSWL